jgi:aminopeptidase N
VYDARTEVSLALLAAAPEAGRKRVRWRAEDVHHFAWSTSPDYIYEGGAFDSIAVHVLYRPGDSTWANGVAVRRTQEALAFYHDVFGPYPWPQITNLHRIEGGGTEFPMMVMDGSASQGLILHEVGHNYVHGILANNEWREGWLDEGFVSYLTNWALEQGGAAVNWQRDIESIRQLERSNHTQPISLPGADFTDPGVYSAMTYTKTSLIFRMLHWLMGDDAFRAALRQYYRDNDLQHVTEADLRAAMDAHYPGELGWFFDQWIHTTKQLDYGLGAVTATHAGDVWTTTVEILRAGDIWMPVDVKVGEVVQRVDSRETRNVITIRTVERPSEVVLDPLGILLDVDPANNRKALPQ